MYNVKCYRRQGGEAFVVGNGGKLVVQTGGAIVPNSEAKAAHIADVSTATVAWTTAEKGRFNTLLANLEALGVLATS